MINYAELTLLYILPYTYIYSYHIYNVYIYIYMLHTKYHNILMSQYSAIPFTQLRALPA